MDKKELEELVEDFANRSEAVLGAMLLLLIEKIKKDQNASLIWHVILTQFAKELWEKDPEEAQKAYNVLMEKANAAG